MKTKKIFILLSMVVFTLTAVVFIVSSPIKNASACPHWCANTHRPFMQLGSPDRQSIIVAYQLGYFNYLREIEVDEENGSALYHNIMSETFEFLMLGATCWFTQVRLGPIWKPNLYAQNNIKSRILCDSFYLHTIGEDTIKKAYVQAENFNLVIGLKNTVEWASKHHLTNMRDFNYQVYVQRLNDFNTNAKFLRIYEAITANNLSLAVSEILEIETRFNAIDPLGHGRYYAVDKLHDPIEVIIFNDIETQNAFAINVFGDPTAKIPVIYDDEINAFRFYISHPGTYIIVEDFDINDIFGLPLSCHNLIVAADFKAVHADTLSLTIDNVSLANRPAVSQAILDFNSFRGAAIRTRDILTNERILLENLRIRMAENSILERFRFAHRIILSRTVQTFTLADRALLNMAFTFIDGFHFDDGINFFGERLYDLLEYYINHLNLLADRVELLNSAHLFRINRSHFPVFALTELTVDIADRPAIINTRTALFSLEPAIRDILRPEQNLIDELLIQIAELERQGTVAANRAIANSFRSIHRDVLTRTTYTVELADTVEVTEALTALNSLNMPVRTLLSEERTLLINLQSRITELERELIDNSSNIGMIIGISAGSAAGVALIIIMLLYINKRNTKLEADENNYE